MKISITSLFLAQTITAIAFSANAANQTYLPAKKIDGSTGIKFSIPYKAGIHHGTSSEVSGKVITDENDNLVKANFTVPISSLSTNNATRDCHMREALGIQYEGSKFPDKHVCDSDNNLPAEGPDSIQFKNITFEFSSFEAAPSTPLPLDIATETQVKASLNIHGIKQDVTLPLKVTKSINEDGSSRLLITGKFPVLLSAHEIKVKPFKLGPFEIGVSDKATVELDLVVDSKQ